jgi:hypothetical protein
MAGDPAFGAASRFVAAAADRPTSASLLDCHSSFDAQGGLAAAGLSAAVERRQGWAGSTCAVV